MQANQITEFKSLQYDGMIPSRASKWHTLQVSIPELLVWGELKVQHGIRTIRDVGDILEPLEPRRQVLDVEPTN